MDDVNAMSIEELRAHVLDAEESALRSLRIRDEVVAENERLKLWADEAITRHITNHPQYKAQEWRAYEATERARVKGVELQTAQLELRLLRRQLRLLKAAR
jgi:hypothetical protein